MKKEISRRNFIKGTAALTAGAALMGLAGCAEEKTPAPQEAPKSKHVKVAVFSPTEGTKNAAAMLAAKFRLQLRIWQSSPRRRMADRSR